MGLNTIDNHKFLYKNQRSIISDHLVYTKHPFPTIFHSSIAFVCLIKFQKGKRGKRKEEKISHFFLKLFNVEKIYLVQKVNNYPFRF